MTTSVQRAVHTDYLGNPIGEPWVYQSVHGEDNDVIDSDPVPSGSVETVLAWVDENGYDPDRVKAALVAEHNRDHPKQPGKLAAPRKSLIAKLEQRLREGR